MSVETGGRDRSKDTYLRHRIKTPEAQLNVAAHAQGMLDYVNSAPSESIRQKRENDLAAAGIDMSGYTDDPACANHDRLLAALAEISEETWHTPLGELVVQDYCSRGEISIEQQ